MKGLPLPKSMIWRMSITILTIPHHIKMKKAEYLML